MVKKIILSVLLCTVCMFTMAQSQTVTHVVQRGETIESIAQYYNVSVEDINKANPNADGVVYVGIRRVLKLNIPNLWSKSVEKDIDTDASLMFNMSPYSYGCTKDDIIMLYPEADADETEGEETDFSESEVTE